MLQIGDEIPDFTSDSTVGMFNLHEVIDGSFTVTFGRAVSNKKV